MALEEQERQREEAFILRSRGIQEDSGPDIDSMTYEELLELGNQIGHVSKGLSDLEIQRLPSFTLNLRRGSDIKE
jgi:hypothetical protein